MLGYSSHRLTNDYPLRTKESYDKRRQYVEKQRHYFADKGPYSQGCGLPSGHVQL